jgi:periplasmic protein TonB
MSSEHTVLTADSAHALAGDWLTPGSRRQPVFWLALLCAALAHAALIYWMGRSSTDYLGDAGGSERAISVELVDAGALRGIGQQSNQPAGQAVPPSAAQPAVEPTPPQQEPSEAVPQQEEAVAPEPPAETAKPAPDGQPDEAAPAAKPPPPKAEPLEAKKPVEAKPAEKAPPKPKALPAPQGLDLSVPSSMAMSGSGASDSTATRPPGITRSGANDRFGRGVIRAMRKTMPPPETGTGRVTVRVIFTPDGAIETMELVQSSGDTILDRSVMFSVREAAFPFPPNGATLADRTFRVTYIYR